MAVSATPGLIALMGFVLLAAGRLQPPDGPGPVGVLVLPWQTGGMAGAAALGLPVVDIRLGGRLLVVDAADPAALQAQGLWLIDVSGAGACLEDRTSGIAG